MTVRAVVPVTGGRRVSPCSKGRVVSGGVVAIMELCPALTFCCLPSGHEACVFPHVGLLPLVLLLEGKSNSAHHRPHCCCRHADLAGAVATGLRVAGAAALFVGRALLLNPIGLAVTAIGLAALAIYKNWEPLKAFFAELWGSVKATFSSAIEWIMGKVATFFAVIDKVNAGAAAIGNAIGTRIEQTNAAMAADGMAFRRYRDAHRHAVAGTRHGCVTGQRREQQHHERGRHHRECTRRS